MFTFKCQKHGPFKSVPMLLVGHHLHSSSWTDQAGRILLVLAWQHSDTGERYLEDQGKEKIH